MLRPCSIAGCGHPAERACGSCMICAKHFCASHLSNGTHTCPTSEDDDLDNYYDAYDAAKSRHLKALLDKVNVTALESAASSARNGITCRIPALADDISESARLEVVSSKCGGQNCHVDVEFGDGVTWIARIRLDDPLLPPHPVQEHIFLSEVATLYFLSRTQVPAPQVYAYALAGPENGVGTSYVLMQKLSGRPLDWPSTTSEQRSKVMEQLADVFLELERHPLPLTGSLTLCSTEGIPGKENGVQAGAFAQVACFTDAEHSLGPFGTLDEAYGTLIRQQIATLLSKEIKDLPVDNSLSFLWRLKHLPDLITGSESCNGPFYLKHYDDKGDHILVDEDHNITGIIDWEFASFEAKELAFSSPCMMWPVRKFYQGSNELAEEEQLFADIFEKRGRKDFSNIVRHGRRWQRYLFFLGGGLARDMDEFEPLFQGLRNSFANNNDGGAVTDFSGYQDWRRDAIGEFSMGGSQLEALLQAVSVKDSKATA